MIKQGIFLLMVLLFPAQVAFAHVTDTPHNEPDFEPYFVVAKITSDGVATTGIVGGIEETTTVYKAEIAKGSSRGVRIEIERSDLFAVNRALNISAGDNVVAIAQLGTDNMIEYQLVDAYRVPALWFAVAIFFLLAILFGRWKGLTSILGLAVSAAIIVWFIVPKIVGGADPLLVGLVGSLLIATVSLFLSHGFNKRTLVAYVATILTLTLSAFMAVAAVSFTHLFGMGSETSVFVLSDLPGISLKGLLLCGIMLGLLGVLDDITTAQSAVVDELKQANYTFGFSELYRRGLSVGREHIASLINTLFLAYAGASLPLFLLFSMNKGQELWMIFNNEMIAEEIIRTLVGSAGLILAVPITTALAAYVFQKHPSAATHKHSH